MQYIDEKFKEAKPQDTVAKIKGILDSLGIEVYETWYDSGLENCYSLTVSAKGGIPTSNGKGITKDFARASAYGESPYDELLLKCDLENCDNCKYNEFCCYKSSKKIQQAVGSIYRNFTDGQNESEFSLN